MAADRIYEEKSWGSVSIEDGKDLPTLKLRRLLDALPRKGSVLEIGCGSGRILASIKERRKTLDLTGVDISAAQIKLAKRDNKGIAFAVGDAEKLPFKDNTFDAVFFLDVIEHVYHPDLMMREAARVLKPGGTLHFFSPAEGHGVYRISKLLFRRHFKEQVVGHVQQFTTNELEDLVRWNGMRLTRRRYSYHLLGSIMDYTLFTLLMNDRLSRVFWSKNKYYQNKQTRQTLVSRVMNAVLSFANAIAYYEAVLLGRMRLLATGVHFTAKK